MSTDEKRIETIFQENQGYIDSVRDGIVEGVSEGIHKGIESGTKRAAWDVLKKECTARGITNIAGVDIETIVEHISQLVLSKDITKTTRDIFRNTLNTYFDRIGKSIIDEFKARLPVLSSITELIEHRKQEIFSQLRRSLPDNPLCIGIADGLQKSIDEALNKSIQGLEDSLKEKIGLEDREQPAESRETVKNGDHDKVKEEVKKSVKDAVAKVVDRIIYEIITQITRRTVAGLKDKLKQALAEELQRITKEQLEDRLTETIDLLKERYAAKCTDKARFISNLDKYLGNSIKKHVLHLASRIPVVVALTATAVVAAGGITYAVTSNQPPVAHAYFQPVAPLAIRFSSEGSYDPDGYIHYFLWHFGDGSTSGDSDPFHEYREPGDYIVVLTVTDDEGQESSTEISVSVEAPSRPPVAIANFEQHGLAVDFYGKESHDPDGGPIVAWHWSFGDGHIFEGATATHEYPKGGNYLVVLAVTDDEGQESSTEISVNVESSPALALSTSSLNFGSVQQGDEDSETFEVWNSGGGTLSYSLAEGATWLSLSETSGTSTGESDNITVVINTSGLSAGPYAAAISVSSNGGADSISVSMDVVLPPALALSTSSLNFGSVQQGDEDSETFEVWNSGGGTLSYSLAEGATWLSLSETSGTSTGESDNITVVINTSGLSAGPYAAAISVSSNGGADSISVSMDVVLPPALALSTSSIDFGTVSAGYTGSKTFQVWNKGGGMLSYNLAEGATWLSLSTTSGNSTGEKDTITVFIDASPFSESSSYLAAISISSNGGTSPILVSANTSVW
ncbi:PKD domain-containing protein [Chloroflexota bacterium]